MAEFVKDLNLGWQLASGVQQPNQRSGSVHFDERMVNQGSGIILKDAGAGARFYAADGSMAMSDIYEVDVLDTGTLQCNTPYSHQTGNIVVLNSGGVEILKHHPAKTETRDTTVTTATLQASGVHYVYVHLEGRRSCEYTMNLGVEGSTLGNSNGSTGDLYGGPGKD